MCPRLHNKLIMASVLCSLKVPEYDLSIPLMGLGHKSSEILYIYNSFFV